MRRLALCLGAGLWASCGGAATVAHTPADAELLVLDLDEPGDRVEGEASRPGAALYDDGRFEDALIALAPAVIAREPDPSARLLFAKTEARLGLFVAAELELAELGRDSSRAGRVFRALARLATVDDLYALVELVEERDEATLHAWVDALEPARRPIAQLAIGVARFERGARDEAAAWLRDTRGNDAVHARAQLLLGQLALLGGRPEEAATTWSSLAPGSAEEPLGALAALLAARVQLDVALARTPPDDAVAAIARLRAVASGPFAEHARAEAAAAALRLSRLDDARAALADGALYFPRSAALRARLATPSCEAARSLDQDVEDLRTERAQLARDLALDEHTVASCALGIDGPECDGLAVMFGLRDGVVPRAASPTEARLVSPDEPLGILRRVRAERARLDALTTLRASPAFDHILETLALVEAMAEDNITRAVRSGWTRATEDIDASLTELDALRARLGDGCES